MIYVDQPDKPFGRMMMCHMISDEPDGFVELCAFASKIGVNTRWIQKSGTWKVHFDICKSKRERAIALGAVPVSNRELSDMMRAKMATVEP